MKTKASSTRRLLLTRCAKLRTTPSIDLLDRYHGAGPTARAPRGKRRHFVVGEGVSWSRLLKDTHEPGPSNPLADERVRRRPRRGAAGRERRAGAARGAAARRRVARRHDTRRAGDG